jgi:hypothetical protein
VFSVALKICLLKKRELHLNCHQEHIENYSKAGHQVCYLKAVEEALCRAAVEVGRVLEAGHAAEGGCGLSSLEVSGAAGQAEAQASLAAAGGDTKHKVLLLID